MGVGGMSQPPWLLAMNGDYLELGDEWNCNSLGRDSMSSAESQTLRRSGFDHKALRTLEVTYSQYGSILPYVVTCTATGKMLHYNGAMKPWLMDRFDKNGPACSLPYQFDPTGKYAWVRTVKVFCEDLVFVQCADLWKSYISDTSACALKDADNEWHEDENKWTSKKSEDEASVLKAKQDDEALQRDIIAMREFEKMKKERLQLQKEQEL